MHFVIRILTAAVLLLLLRDLSFGEASKSRYVRRDPQAKSVIVYVHGVLGDSTSTWTNGTTFWPNLLKNDKDFDGTNIYVYEYPTELLSRGFSIDEITENMRLRFEADKVSAHPELIFLVHSMGGLATRAFLLKYRESAARTRLVYFYSTPTTGSEVAAITTLVSRNPQFAKMRPMQSADYLADLQRQWLAAGFNIPSFCAYETRPTYGLTVVTQASAASLCNRRLDPIAADHLSIVKPDSSTSDIYIAFKSAVQTTPSITGQGTKIDCKPGTQKFQFGKDITSTAIGVCKDEVSGNELRIRYLWLDANSISMLLSDTIVGALARSVGERPFISNNVVTDELRKVIARFGSTISTARPTYVSWGVNATNKDGRTEGTAGESAERRFSKKFTFYDAEDGAIYPDPEPYKIFQKTANFPDNFGMSYWGYIPSNPTSEEIMNGVKIWKFVEEKDLTSYAEKTLRLAEMITKKQLPMPLTDIGPQLDLKRIASSQRAAVPRSIAAMQYFARDGWPRKYLLATGDTISCGIGAYGFTITIWPRKLFVQVAVIDGIDQKSPISISQLKAEQTLSSALRSADEDGQWLPVTLDFPVGRLAPGESIVVPLRIELRSEGAPNMVGLDEAKSLFGKISAIKREIVKVTKERKVIFEKSRSSFRAPDDPQEVSAFTYGPRMRLISASAGSGEVPLRQFDPAHLWTQFGEPVGSCPTIYFNDAETNELVSYGRVLRGAVGEDMAREEVIWFDGGTNRIELVEDEPEITKIQKLRVLAIDGEGNEALVHEEVNKLVAPGMPLVVENEKMREAARIRVEIKGYYVPLPTLIASEMD